MLNAPKRLPGLLRLAPFLLFAMLPHAEATPRQTQRRTLAPMLSAAFVLVAVLTTNTSAGAARPAAAAADLAIARRRRAAGRQGTRARPDGQSLSHRILAGGGAALVLAGFIINAALLMPLYRARGCTQAAGCWPSAFLHPRGLLPRRMLRFARAWRHRACMTRAYSSSGSAPACQRSFDAPRAGQDRRHRRFDRRSQRRRHAIATSGMKLE
ncbi:MAG: hypothetical protein MZU84_04085 [Sphingobacterium sp.]|nr:hypothetical protein [Sphingobacterium sp.]